MKEEKIRSNEILMYIPLIPSSKNIYKLTECSTHRNLVKSGKDKFQVDQEITNEVTFDSDGILGCPIISHWI